MRVKERSIIVLQNVQRLISTPWCWSKDGQLAEDVNGRPVDPHDPAAVKWSFVGALTRYETSILAINAIQAVSGCDLRTLELRATRPELLVILQRGIKWLEQWREYDSR